MMSLAGVAGMILCSARPWMTPCLQHPGPALESVLPLGITMRPSPEGLPPSWCFFALEHLCDPLPVSDEGEVAGRGIELLEQPPVLPALLPPVDGRVRGLLPELVLDALPIRGPERAEPLDGAILCLR